MKTSLSRVVDLTSIRRQPACRQTLEQVGADQHPLVLECRLEQRGRSAGADDLARLRQGLWDMTVVVCDTMATGIAPARDFADLVSGIENRLKGIIGHARELACVALVPQPKVALGPSDVTRFGESGPGCHETGPTVPDWLSSGGGPWVPCVRCSA